jgi:hypothetical protein
MFHDVIDAFAVTLSLFLIISQQGELQLFMSQLRLNLSSIFYDGKCFVSQEFLLQSPFPSPPSAASHSQSTSQTLFITSSTPSASLFSLSQSPSQSNPVIGSQTPKEKDIEENEDSVPLPSSHPLSEFEIFQLFSQHYLHLHSSFHYLTVTYGKYLFFLIASMLCTVLYLILYIYAYRGGSSISSLIESVCSLYVLIILMFNLAKVNVFGRHVQTLITRKCIHLLTTLQPNPFLPASSQSQASSRVNISSRFPSPSLMTLPTSFSSSFAPELDNPSASPRLSLSESPVADRMIFYHQINGFVSCLQILRLTFGFTRYFALDYNGLSALLLSLVLSVIPRLLTNHIHN